MSKSVLVKGPSSTRTFKSITSAARAMGGGSNRIATERIRVRINYRLRNGGGYIGNSHVRYK